jgi:hypothetical protein
MNNIPQYEGIYELMNTRNSQVEMVQRVFGRIILYMKAHILFRRS